MTRKRVAPLGGFVFHDDIGDFDRYLYESSAPRRAVRLMQVVIAYSFADGGSFSVIAPLDPPLGDPRVRWAAIQMLGDGRERHTVRELQARTLGSLVRGLELAPGQIVAFEIEIMLAQPPSHAVIGFKVEVL